MDFNEYQELTHKTAGYAKAGEDFIYPALGLTGEAGEVADKIKKHIRDDNIKVPADLSHEQRMELTKELGDVLWYIAQLSAQIGVDLETVAKTNIEKTHSRFDRNQISGSGDNR